VSTAARHEGVRWRAPGRVNLIGDHTDYNEGFAMPLAIDRTCAATARTLDEPVLLLRSVRPEAQARVALAELSPGHPDGWAGYIGGVVWSLLRRGIELPGLAIEIDSNVPMGAGLASSAALTCSVASSINDLLGLGLGRRDRLEVAVSAENDFVGAPTGGMDQLAALYGSAGNVLFCDMRDLDVTPVPFDFKTARLTLLAIDTGITHSHAGGEYGARRAGCAQAARILGVQALCDVTDLEAALAMLPAGPLRGYVRHVVTENERVLAAAQVLRGGAIDRIGPLMNASHDSLRDDYLVSTPELDLAVETLRAMGALGARMTGGGFGGTVIALLDSGLTDKAFGAVRLIFAVRGYPPPRAFTVHPSRGAYRA
jgi:galactokinase